ncbi:hypothetical protein SJAV_09710 [Sulfurisphaera javensis]|uniref:Uncharacterized protein n=1 Tax=Sulfurisphaera javensis TaxID=2049879 RepID=A0AAT9GQF7_9CREN
MYANSMRAFSSVLQVPLGMVFTWIKKYGSKKYNKFGRRARNRLDESGL